VSPFNHFILDTNICIYIIKRRSEHLLSKLSKLDPERVSISSVTWSELLYGAEKSLAKEKNLEALRNFVMPFEILPWRATEAEAAGAIRATLEKIGKPIGPFDLMIAAQAVTSSSILVTNNEREFRRVKELKVENWAK
jgi:tRNA(fMet)-specific endonuclease VapC